MSAAVPFQSDGIAPDAAALLAGEHREPHRWLGAHPVTDPSGRRGVVVRAMHPDARGARCVAAGRVWTMREAAPGIFEARIPDVSLPLEYSIRFAFPGGASWETRDPWSFAPTIGEMDQYLFREGTHLRLWDVLGATVRVVDGVQGVTFAVWAPNARGVSVVGDFCDWDGRRYPMRVLGSSGIFEIFIPGVREGALYKYEVRTEAGATVLKTDPFARYMEQPPGNASIVTGESRHKWGDREWLNARIRRNHYGEPMLIYEVHLGSWARVVEDGNRPLTYREIAPRLAEHVRKLGVTHVELMPVAEHPFTGSWGYQVTGFFAPTSRYGSPDDLRYLVDELHAAGIAVILDWVPAHFPRDDFALCRFDGTALYEHEDPRRGEHPDWGTTIFNLARREVEGFLVANALYWLKEFHFDGLRVDAVASMLYLDYSRGESDWVRNEHGGRENLEAVAFLRRVNEMIRQECPGCITVAEESTAWPGVTAPVHDGGLGFTYKWNLGWMHDTLTYFGMDPIHRSFHHDMITFAMLYEHTERFVMPLSHDEVVHMKGSLLTRMPGDTWQMFANLRALMCYMYTRPGKKLIFMGSELAPWREWDHDSSLDWHLLSEPLHREFHDFLCALGRLYRAHPALWSGDYRSDGFQWLDVNDREQSVYSWMREGDGECVVVVVNLTPVPRSDYRMGVPYAGGYDVLLNSDAPEFGGSGAGSRTMLTTDAHPFHSRPVSITASLPPLGALILRHTGANT